MIFKFLAEAINCSKNIVLNFKNLLFSKKYNSSFSSVIPTKQSLNRGLNIFLWDATLASSKLRLIFIMICFTFCFVLIIFRIINISLNGHKVTAKIIDRNLIKRKDIVDRNGTLLAVNLPSASLFASPKKIIDIENSVNKIAEIVNINKKKLINELKSNKNFVWVKRDLLPKEQLELLNLSLPGFDFEKEQKRIYTFGNLLSHVIGYVGRDFNGLAGIEKFCDVELLKLPLNKKEEYNSSLALTIDVRLQNILNEEIDKIIKNFNAAGGAGIIVNPKNGEILAMLSKPDFNPHRPQEAKPEQLFNNASLGVRELGSVFKGITMVIGLDVGVITLNDAYDLSYMKVGKFQIKDDHPMQGWHSVPEIFIRSSNIGVGQIILEIGKNNLMKYLKDFGLLDQIGVELPERGYPIFPKDGKISDISLITMSYGYGMSNSPLGFVRAMVPIINGGTYYPLTLLKQSKHPEGKKILKESTSKDMLKLYRLTVKEGSGRKANVEGYLVGGKTGTAFKAFDGKYNKTKRISSFVAMFPTDDPDYLIYIMIDEPKGNKESFGFATGGWVVAPLIKRLIERMVSLYGLEAADKQSLEIDNSLSLDHVIEDEA